MSAHWTHLVAMPIVLPVMAAGVLLLVERAGIGLQRAIALLATLAQAGVALALLVQADAGAVTAYLVGDWPARLGITLVLDRLAALMLLTSSLLGLAGVAYACAGWDRRAAHFHAFYQVLLMGLAFAFLTGDVFNLFVAFEVLLIASYGLMLSGGRGPRMRVGLHYVAFNIAASTLYLFAVGLLYGLLGALNMAELAVRVAVAPAENLPLIAAAGGMLLVVFWAKAALFPLALWLPGAYTRTPAPAVVLFAIMTKLGVYCVLRVHGLVFGPDAGPLAGFAWDWLLPAAALGLALSALGVVAARSLRQLAAYLVVGSAATLFLAIALDVEGTIAAGLYYLPQSSFAAAALFLLADLVRRRRGAAGDGLDRLATLRDGGVLGAAFFVLAVVLVGLPPLSGFLAKLALLPAVPAAHAAWVWPLVLGASLLALLAMARAGAQVFWRQPRDAAPAAPRPLRPAEWAPVAMLLALCVAMSVFAAPALRYAGDAAAQLADAEAYRAAVLEARSRVRSNELEVAR